MSEKLVLMDGHSILNRAFFGIPDLTNSEGLHTNAVYGFLNIMFKILEEEKPDYLTVAHSILNRAFFGIPDLTNSEGLHTNAVYGFLNIMFKILEEEKPDYLTVAFDVPQPTFRHEMFAEYKGTRKPMASELREQVPLMKEMLSAMGVTVIEKGGYEADDLLGTIAKSSEEQGLEVSVVSGDRDLLQLASEHIKIRIPKTKRTGTEIEDYYASDVVEKYQVTPEQFIDVRSILRSVFQRQRGLEQRLRTIMRAMWSKNIR